jgi:hypothetical protein
MLAKSARHFGINDIRMYGPEHTVIQKLHQDYPTIMSQPHGGGYWLWKPFIIADAMSDAPLGTPILYLDSAMTIVSDPRGLIDLTTQHPAALFKLVPDHPMSTWTKRDCFVELDADSEEYWSLPQVSAGFQLYRTGSFARDFVQELKEAMPHERRLTDMPNTHGLPDLPDFRAHRHDQSIITILAYRAGIPLFPDPSQHGKWGTQDALPAPYGKMLHIHRKKNVGLWKHTKFRLKRVYTGGAYFL